MRGSSVRPKSTRSTELFATTSTTSAAATTVTTTVTRTAAPPLAHHSLAVLVLHRRRNAHRQSLQADAALVQSHLLLALAVRSPRVLVEAVVEIVGDVGARLAPRFLVQRIDAELVRRHAADRAHTLELVDAELARRLLRLGRLPRYGRRAARPQQRRSLLDVVVLAGLVRPDLANDHVDVVVRIVVAVAERIVVVAVVAVAAARWRSIRRAAGFAVCRRRGSCRIGGVDAGRWFEVVLGIGFLICRKTPQLCSCQNTFAKSSYAYHKAVGGIDVISSKQATSSASLGSGHAAYF